MMTLRPSIGGSPTGSMRKCVGDDHIGNTDSCSTAILQATLITNTVWTAAYTHFVRFLIMIIP